MARSDTITVVDHYRIFQTQRRDFFCFAEVDHPTVIIRFDLLHDMEPSDFPVVEWRHSIAGYYVSEASQLRGGVLTEMPNGPLRKPRIK
ncbi:hypothetical protein TSMEX_005763 [Taenia solium]|eukprot:TsM_000312300 transcript=TsM_000312300 gene=TsM_000312300